jgi:hypothetical protein
MTWTESMKWNLIKTRISNSRRRYIDKTKNLQPMPRKKGNEKCTELSSNEWRVRRYYNTDLRQFKNWFLDKWRSNRSEIVEDMRGALADFPHALHSMVSSSCFSSITSERFSGSTLIFTDGSRSEEGTGFGIYVDHNLWSCPLYRHERIQLWSQLSTSNRPICVRDMLALRQWCDIRVCVSFLSSINFHVWVELSSS